MRKYGLFLAIVALAGCTVIIDDELARRRDAGAETDGGGMDASSPDASPTDEPDGGGDDAGGGGDGCVPSAEVCDGIDSDCDRAVDENVRCDLPNATSACVSGACAVTACSAGHLDCDDAAPGCESENDAHASCGACDVGCAADQECATGPTRCAPRPIGWFKQIRNTTNRVMGVAGIDVDAAGVVYAAVDGPFQIDAVTAATPAPHIVGLTSSGAVSWVTNIQQTGQEHIIDIAAAPTGGALIGALTRPSGNSEIYLWARYPGSTIVSAGPYARDAALIGYVAANGVPSFLRAIVAPAVPDGGLVLHDVAVLNNRAVVAGTQYGSPWMLDSTPVAGPVWLARTTLPTAASIDVRSYGAGWLSAVGIALYSWDTVVAGIFEGEFEVGGRTFSAPAFSNVMWRVGADGSVLWSQQFPLTGDVNEETPPYPTFDAAGNLYVRGDCTSATCTFGEGTGVPTGRFIASYAGDGTFRWARPIGGRNFGAFRANVEELILVDEVALNDDLGGGPFSTTGGSTDAALAVYDTRGVYQWGARFGGALHDTVGGAAANAIDQTFFAGTFRGLVNVAGTTYSASAAMGDAFIMRIDPIP